MPSEKYKQCQDCKKVFKLSKACQSEDNHECPFCSSWNTAYVDKKIYKQYYGKSILNKDRLDRCP